MRPSPNQQLQFLQVHASQRQPVSVFASMFFFTSILLLPVSELTPYARRTMVRNQVKKLDTIGGLARAAGVHVETVRYYQRRGLLPEPPRPSGEVRRYSEDDVKRLRFIRSAQAAGFTLAEIGELLELNASDDRARARELAQARVSMLDQKIAELRDARDALMKLANACASSRKGPCPILSAFERAKPKDSLIGHLPNV
jgi:MerR family mercuric resistance operon transcriptional regulator